MSTELQQNLAKEIIANSKRKKPKNKRDMLVSVGYATSTAEVKQKEIMEQKGVQEALIDFGFNVDNAKKVVAEILLDPENDPNSRLKATDQVFKVHGAYAPEKNVNVNLNVNEENPDIQAIAIKVAEDLKRKKINPDIISE